MRPISAGTHLAKRFTYARSRCAVGGGILLERQRAWMAMVDLAAGTTMGASPMAVGVERHEFDKAHDDAGFAGRRRSRKRKLRLSSE